MKTSLFAAVSIAALLTACTSEKTTGVVVSRSPQLHSPVSYKVRVRMVYPPYLMAGVPSDARIHLQMNSVQLASYEKARKLVVDSVIVETHPGGDAVLGAWKGRLSNFIFSPHKPLAPGDYLVRFKNDSGALAVTPTPYNLFRVGSGPLRLREIGLLPDKAGGTELKQVRVVFSEAVNPDTVSTRVESQANGMWKPIPVAVNSTTSRILSLRSDVPLKMHERIRITAENSGLTASGAGTPGKVILEFRPDNHRIGHGTEVRYYPLLGSTL